MCQVKPIGSSWVIVVWSCWKTEIFALTKIILVFYQSVIKCQLFLQKINNKKFHAVLIFQNFWSYTSIKSLQIATDYSVFDRFCFLCVVCLFWWIYGFLWWVFSIEKLEYNRYNAKKMNSFGTVLIVVVCFLILTDLTNIFVEFCVILRWMKE